MELDIPIGASASVDLLVSDDDTAIAAGSGDVPVLATPRVVALCEQAACAAIAECLPEDFTSVGVLVDLDHKAPTPVGLFVTAHAEVIAVEGRRIEFAISLKLDGHAVASGNHDRIAVDRKRFLDKMGG